MFVREACASRGFAHDKTNLKNFLAANTLAFCENVSDEEEEKRFL
jgi:hypothetical protein